MVVASHLLAPSNQEPTNKELTMSKIIEELKALTTRLGKDGYPTALLEQTTQRMIDMEAEILRCNTIINNLDETKIMQNDITETLFGTKDDIPIPVIVACCAVIPITIVIICIFLYINGTM